MGVDIFFVISGYLISSILMQDFFRNSFSIWNFYNRRIRRIFPALIVILLFIAVAGWFCLFNPEFIALGRHVSAATLFSENFLLWKEANYFDVSSNLKPTLHLWSLAIEEQFYILWPMLMFFAYRQRINFALMCGIFASVSFGINLHEIYTDPTAAYYSPLGRSWELMIGSCLAYIQALQPQLLTKHRNLRSWAGLGLIVLAFMLIRPRSAFPGFWALLPTMGCALLISAGGSTWLSRRVLSAAPMVWCGLISYPLYLWHWVLLSFGHIIFGTLSIKKTIVCVLASVAAATLTFFFVERRFRSHENSRKKSLGLLTAMAGLLGIGLLISTEAVAARLKHFDLPKDNEFTFLRKRTPGFDDENGIAFYPLHANRPNLVLFIGDSHLAQYAAHLDKVLSANPQLPGAILAVGGGCMPIANVTEASPQFARCWQLREKAYKMAEENKFKTVVIGGAWSVYFLNADYVYNEGDKQIPLASIEGKAAALRELRHSIEKLVRSGKRVIFLLDNPNSGSFDPGGQANRLDFSLRNFKPDSETTVDMRQTELQQELYRLANGAGAHVINPFDAVCKGIVCRTTTADGQPLYRDYQHFNPDWAINHADFVDETVE